MSAVNVKNYTTDGADVSPNCLYHYACEFLGNNFTVLVKAALQLSYIKNSKETHARICLLL